jgi:hypothetical protein
MHGHRGNAETVRRSEFIAYSLARIELIIFGKHGAPSFRAAEHLFDV